MPHLSQGVQRNARNRVERVSKLRPNEPPRWHFSGPEAAVSPAAALIVCSRPRNYNHTRRALFDSLQVPQKPASLMASYHYQSLPDPGTWIRLLHLHAGAEGSPLRGSLEDVAVQGRNHYEGLSYFCGSNVKPCKLYLTSRSQEYVLQITTNLSLALQRMRLEDGSRDRIMWADAVCIDQENDREKEQQVRIMHKIYTNATRVLVYLGEPERSLQQAIKLLKKIHTSSTKTVPSDQSVVKWVEANGLPSVLESWKWEPLKAFFRRPWFRRKWTIQECALASEVVFHCGTWHCDWNWMMTVIGTIYDKGLAVSDYTTSINNEEALKLQRGMSQINSIRLYRLDRLNGSMFCFQDLAYLFQTAEATDKRDHLFALLGMATDTDDEQLDPLYGSSTISKTCLRYAYFFLHRDRSLEVLYRAGITGHELLAPSWIPNWYGGHQNFGFESNEGLWRPGLRPRHLHVARGTTVSITSNADSVVLGVKGVVIDEIKDLANKRSNIVQDIRHSKESLRDYRRQHLLECDRIMSQIKTYPGALRYHRKRKSTVISTILVIVTAIGRLLLDFLKTMSLARQVPYRQNLKEVQWRTLLCNTTRSNTIPDDTFSATYEAWRRVTLNTPLVPCSEADRLDSKSFDAVVHVWNVAKLFGLTIAGYVGMFPFHARNGDKIAVLYGGEFPFVLRPCSEPPTANYELVGQCYIHGIMEEGQLNLKQWRHEEQDILLGGSYTDEENIRRS